MTNSRRVGPGSDLIMSLFRLRRTPPVCVFVRFRPIVLNLAVTGHGIIHATLSTTPLIRPVLPLSDAQVYARQFLPIRHGYPLWCPESYGHPVGYHTKGVRIGDATDVTCRLRDGGFQTRLVTLSVADSQHVRCQLL